MRKIARNTEIDHSLIGAISHLCRERGDVVVVGVVVVAVLVLVVVHAFRSDHLCIW